MSFGLPAALAALLIPVALGILLAMLSRRRDTAVSRYEDRGGAGPLLRHVSGRRRVIRVVLLVAGATCIALAAARPQWGTRPELLTREGADVAIVIDVSVSMLAQDIAPNRLERAKQEARDLVLSLRGDRVGLAVFAGTSFQRFPLTNDLALAAGLIEAVRVEPREVESGTALDAGIRGGLELLAASTSAAKAIVVFSDGEDLTGSQIVAVQEAADRGVRIYALGIGGTGATIPVFAPGTDRIVPKTDPRTGQSVVSRLVEEGLRFAAGSTGGEFTAVTPGGGNASSLSSAIAGLENTTGEDRQEDRPIERFQLFVALGLALLGVQLLLGEAPRRMAPWLRRVRLSPLAAGLLLTGCAAGVGIVNDRANTLFERERFRDALERYREVQSERPDLLEVHYNIGTTLYKLGDYDRAVTEFQRSVQSPDGALAERSLYALGNTYVRMGRLQDAVRSYRAALKLDPDDEDAKFNLELIQARLTPTPTPEPSETPGTETPTGSATPDPSSTATSTGTPDGTGTPGSSTPDPNATGTPGPDGSPTADPSGTASPEGSPTPSASATREPGNPELPDDPSNAQDRERTTEEQLRELLRALDDPDLSPEDALRILDAYRAAQEARDAERDQGPLDGGTDDW